MSSPESVVAGPHFRPDIQGLRAVAALLVAVYHIWLGRVSGGVDVFFVVSGFLITASLLRQVETNGRLDIPAYLTRLIKRLLPASLVVLAAVFAASLVLMLRVHWAETSWELLASALYYENWQLAANAVDYLAQDRDASPVQHYWALSVQGQFYLVWPLVIAGVLWAHRARGAGLRGALFAAFGVIFAASLAYSIRATADDQAVAYFNTFTRLWEFAIGGLLAVALPGLRLPRLMRVAMGWIGLAAILACGLVFQVSTVFPGYAALWPTTAAALVLAAGNTGTWLGVDRLLGSRPLVWLGNISYGVYLWHWPILVFYLMGAGRDTLIFEQGLALLAASVLAAAITTRAIERPVRTSTIGRGRWWHGPAFGAACLAPVVVPIGSWAWYLEARQRAIEEWMVDNPDYPGAAAVSDDFTFIALQDVPTMPGPLVAKRDVPAVYRDRCHQGRVEPEPLRCDYGVEEADETILVVGGSHAAHWLPALQRAAEAANWKVISFTKSACRFTTRVERGHDSCREWNERVVEEILDIEPDLVFTTATVARGRREHVPVGYVEQWHALEPAGIPILAVRNTPDMGFDVPACVERYGADAARCRLPRREVLAPNDRLFDIDELPANVHVADWSEYFCPGDECPAVLGNVLVYRDGHHITATYARTLTPVVREAIEAVLGRQSQGAS